MKIYRVVLLAIGMGWVCLTSAFAGQQTILGVHKNNLIEYSAEGRKLGVLDNVTDQEINGTAVLATNSRNLMQVRFRGKDMWLRASALRLAMPILPKCPQAAPGRAVDRTTPVASGMGADCEQ